MLAGPKISVVTPSWNQGKFLSDCIESVASLDDGLVEHIIVDNCSDDETAEVIAHYPHLRTLVEKDRGQSDALNKGFAMARAPWILWLNADDVLCPGMLEAYIAAVAARPGLDAVYGHMIFIDEKGRQTRVVYQPQWRYYMGRFGACYFPSTGTLFRSSLLKESPLGEDYHMVMDTEWTLRNAKRMRIKRLRRRAVSFRVTPENKTSEHITTGKLTPQHAKERKMICEGYAFYGGLGENRFGRFGNGVLNLVRRFIRLRILVDKAISRGLDR